MNKSRLKRVEDNLDKIKETRSRFASMEMLRAVRTKSNDRILTKRQERALSFLIHSKFDIEKLKEAVSKLTGETPPVEKSIQDKLRDEIKELEKEKDSLLRV